MDRARVAGGTAINRPSRRLTRAATSLGHAGILIECEAGSILCDPWFEPAFLGSWFVFPETTNLMLNYFIASNMLIISMCRTYTVTTTTRTGLRHT